ncbi:MAG: DegT/DnrJ/EryC1/StrS family aminotransferase, partial [Lachnospiraceae bacterium]|nr:DegT/DnrJ/EryC1/StrS family aminotransferase [Lachnospiraceae bacterium]
MLTFNLPPYVGDELKYIEQVIKRRKLCGDGDFTKKCNKWFEDELGTCKALLTTSCTHATEMAVLLSDVGEGDEVIMPSFAFVSAADSMVLRGGVPVFVD